MFIYKLTISWSTTSLITWMTPFEAGISTLRNLDPLTVIPPGPSFMRKGVPSILLKIWLSKSPFENTFPGTTCCKSIFLKRTVSLANFVLIVGLNEINPLFVGAKTVKGPVKEHIN